MVAGYGGANEVWDFQDESVVDATPPSFADPDRRVFGVASCDVDGDGKEEVYFLNIDQFGGLGEVSDRLYNDGGWSDLFEAATNTGVINQFSDAQWPVSTEMVMGGMAYSSPIMVVP